MKMYLPRAGEICRLPFAGGEGVSSVIPQFTFDPGFTPANMQQALVIRADIKQESSIYVS